MVVDRKYRKALALPCLNSSDAANSSDVLRLDSTVTPVTQATGLITINTGVFLGKMCSYRCKNHGCGQKKPGGTSSAIFEIGSAANYCELKRCAEPRSQHGTDNKDEVFKSNLNFLLS